MITPDREINPPEVIECPNCLGDGVIKSEPVLVEMEDGVWGEEIDIVQCIKCEGSGML